MTDPTQTALFDSAPTNGHAARLGDDTEAEERPGYQFVKRIGWIPEDWDVRALRTAGRIVTGSTPATGNDVFYGGPYPFVGPGDLGGFKVVSGSDRMLSEAGLSQTRPVPAGSVLFTCISFAIGKTGQAGTLLATNQQINAVVPNEKHDGDFLYYLLTFLSGRIRRLAGIQATPILNKTDFGNVVLPLPPLPEQREIARVLGAWDRTLADLDALINAKRQRARGLAQRLLTGRVRLPGFEDRIPMRPLGDFFRHVSTRNKERRDLTPLSCSKVHGIVPQSQIFDKRIASDDTSNYKVVQRGDLVYDPMLLWDASIGFVDTVDEGVISPAYATFHLNEKTADRSFFRHFFNGHYMRHQYKVISQGTNTRRRKAMAKDFLDVDARVPPLDEQRQIAAVLNAAGAEIAAHEAERAALAAQKRGLMQRLLTGEVRVLPSSSTMEQAL